MWGNKAAESKGMFPTWLRQSIGPLLLILVTQPFAFTMTYVNDSKLGGNMNGSLLALFHKLIDTRGGVIVEAFNATWPHGEDATKVAQIILSFAIFQLILMKIVPGKIFKGPISPTGHVPVYTANGFQCYFIAVCTFLVVTLGFKWVSALEILRLYPSCIAVMSVVSLGFCLFLTIKGHVAPSGTDAGSTGNVVMDYYWGTELYPRVFGWDVKMFTNCRFGMMAWAILPIAFFAGTIEAGRPATYAQMVNLVLQLVYIAKFFEWETGYLATIDIMHDRAGYYICWGCLVWVPSTYIVHSHYIASQVMAGTFVDISGTTALIFLAAGVLCVYVNYDADLQRMFVRQQGGKCTVWGKPAEVIRATYTTEGDKTVKTSILLVSGYWGLARHFHYVPEILAAVFWTIPAGFNHALPWFYVVFLTFLLFDRAYRDDARCRAKYGVFWDKYCMKVPYKVIPGII